MREGAGGIDTHGVPPARLLYSKPRAGVEQRASPLAGMGAGIYRSPPLCEGLRETFAAKDRGCTHSSPIHIYGEGGGISVRPPGRIK